MYLEELRIQGIRNIRYAELQLSPGPNLFFGPNGSGKTSILEAVFILSRGRSFRSRSLQTVLSNSQQSLTCFGVVNSGDPFHVRSPVGVMREEGGKFFFKINGLQVNTASQLSDNLPVQVVNSESFELLEGSPSARRAFIDWGVFHVEHGYREVWSRFQRCLKHRNSLLRHGKMDSLQLAVWDREFCTLAVQMDECRSRYLEQLVAVLNSVLVNFGFESAGFEFNYYPGWDSKVGLPEQLQQSLVRDMKAGHSTIGPHRADLRIQRGSQAAVDFLSRGQIKSLVIGLKLAQCSLFQALSGRRCLFLVDDLPSELDFERRSAVCRELSALGVQAWVTGIEKSDLEVLWPTDTTRVFHVKHGEIERV